MADRIVKVGVIGCGGIANQKHLPSLHKLPNVQLVAFCDIIVEKAEKAAKAAEEKAKKIARIAAILNECDFDDNEFDDLEKVLMLWLQNMKKTK